MPQMKPLRGGGEPNIGGGLGAAIITYGSVDCGPIRGPMRLRSGRECSAGAMIRVPVNH
jgi:hypothetical protein